MVPQTGVTAAEFGNEARMPSRLYGLDTGADGTNAIDRFTHDFSAAVRAPRLQGSFGSDCGCDEGDDSR